MSTPTSTAAAVTTSPLLCNESGDGHQPNRVESVFSMSIPKVICSMINNTVTVVIAIVVILLSRNETPDVPLRTWIVVYSAMCLLAPFLQCIEYRRLTQIGVQSSDVARSNMTTIVLNATSIFYVIWWMIGCYWILSSGKVLTKDAPFLYWFTAIILAWEAVTFAISVLAACIKSFSNQ